MTKFFELFIDYIGDFWACLDRFGFEFYGFTVSIPSMLVAFILIGLCVSFFWKGART